VQRLAKWRERYHVDQAAAAGAFASLVVLVLEPPFLHSATSALYLAGFVLSALVVLLGAVAGLSANVQTSRWNAWFAEMLRRRARGLLRPDEAAEFAIVKGRVLELIEHRHRETWQTVDMLHAARCARAVARALARTPAAAREETVLRFAPTRYGMGVDVTLGGVPAEWDAELAGESPSSTPIAKH
jgi:hypothetical protein